jgi:hypothetical protein
MDDAKLGKYTIRNIHILAELSLYKTITVSVE